ncbi:hypothetical protein Pla175_43410 [Pirellulimonas nuda]|uniref:Ice-binding protein C-terminal domain-containing protein n=1 Tax=Pirellulimonas nuda TaxID=2528009 RepID=A0A518DHH8_9BACT|nr:PEP-CTERM sorting domain-containing protein [Pirellulimonas nuda]QDU90927.1 hypothetical protein Pla175_43410 [Pirellulimonas nuda]
MKLLSCGLAAAICVVVMRPVHAAPILVEVDFSGAGGSAVGVIASSDAQFTVVDPAVTFGATAFSAVGGASGTSTWVYDATGAAAANPDLHTASTFGAPTRFDVDLAFAAAGATYTITSVEIDVRASNSAGTNWDFMYRKPDNTTAILPGGAITVQSGADPITTYSIDVTSENLTATDSATAWSASGTGKLRLGFYEATASGNDNFQVDAIRFIGTSSSAVPEPTAACLLGLSLAGAVLARRRLR